MDQNISGWRINTVGDNLIFLVGFGEWSETEARGFCTEYKQLVSGFGERSWAVIGDATDWNLDDPEVQELLRNQNRWITGHGCRAACFYTGPGALNRLLLYRLAEPDSDEFRFRVYPDRRRAVEALGNSGFPVSDPQLERFFRGEGSRS